jgi:catechol 2,3-dioxygenase-like lactoylglutathione lyase family enzyme
MELSAVRIFVNDLPAAAKFYEDVVALPLVSNSSPDFVIFGDRPIILLEPAGDDPEDRDLVGRFTGLSFATDDADALHAELSRKGVPTHGAPERESWGGTLLHADDPSGNTITFVQMPARAAG